jgi:hypothetical protein
MGDEEELERSLAVVRETLDMLLVALSFARTAEECRGFIRASRDDAARRLAGMRAAKRRAG